MKCLNLFYHYLCFITSSCSPCRGLRPCWKDCYGYNPKKRKRESRSKYPTWFHKLTGNQLEQLLKAAKLPSSGNKNLKIDRLQSSDETSRFALEPRCLSRPTIFNIDRPLEYQHGKWSGYNMCTHGRITTAQKVASELRGTRLIESDDIMPTFHVRIRNIDQYIYLSLDVYK